jgi:DNA-binding NtrC family response regulator
MEGIDTILVVDDNESTVKTLKNILKFKFGVPVLGFLSCDEASHAIKNANIDVVISDGYVVDKTGINLYDELEKYCKETGRKMPAFVLQTGASNYFEAPCAERNIPLVAKPFDIKDLKQAVEKSIKDRNSQ